MTLRARLFPAVFLGALLLALPAQAALDVAWDCYLPSAQVGCAPLEAALFSNASFARAAAVPEAFVTVRASPVADGVSYTIEVRGQEGATIALVDRVPGGFSSDAVLLRLIGDVQKSTAHLFVIEEPGATVDGVLTLKLRDPDAGPRSARSDDATTGWYLAPSLNLNAERFGLSQLHINGAIEVNWSHPDWRLRGWTWSSYRLVVAEPVTGTEKPEDLRYENFDAGTDWTIARAFGGLSPAANLYVLREPRQNFLLRSGALVGVEWVLVPFLKTDEGNVGVQYVIGAEHQEYQNENVLELTELSYMKHRARVFGAWHFSRVDLDGSVTAASALVDVRFSSVSASGGASWRILDDLSLSMNGEISFRNGLLNEPKDLSQLHPLEQFYGGGAYGDVTAWTWVGLKYTFGNSLLSRQDQRWR